jgi:hypothetical protein
LSIPKRKLGNQISKRENSRGEHYKGREENSSSLRPNEEKKAFATKIPLLILWCLVYSFLINYLGIFLICSHE